MDMKGTVESGLLALKGFYEVVNTKERALLLILAWLLVGASFLGHRFANVETVERLIVIYHQARHHQLDGDKTQVKTEAPIVAKTNKG